MAEYVSYPIETDPDVLAQEAIDWFKDQYPGWSAADANLETQMLLAFARMAADARDVASDVPDAIFRYFGATIAGITPIAAAKAEGLTTWTAIDTLGHTIPAGTLVGIRDGVGNIHAFETVTDIVIPEGASTTSVGEVAVVALEEGSDQSALTGDVTLIDTLDFVDTVTLVGATSGGIDAEEDEDYLDRLKSELELMAPRPILPRDFAVLARRVPGVERAVAIDGLDPADMSTGNERMVTVAMVDENGDAVAPLVKTAVQADLQARREVTFIVNVMDPTYTEIDVVFSAVAYPGWDVAAVESAAEAAVADYLHPRDWGQPAFGDQREWINVDKVRYFEIITVLNNVQGLDYVVSCTVNGGTADVTLTGAVPLPQVGTVVGTVTAP